MLKRKLNEIASILYRRICYPFVRTVIEIRTRSIMKQGSYLNKGSVLEGRNYIGRDAVLSNVRVGYGSVVNGGADISDTEIGKYVSIGARLRTDIGMHPVDGRHAALHTAFYSTKNIHGFSYALRDTYTGDKYLDEKKGIRVRIGNDVWIGNDVILMEGVTIGDGAAIAAGAVVTSDIEPYVLYGGVPARKLRDRFPADKAEKLLELKWWYMDEDAITEKFRNGEFDDIDVLLKGRNNGQNSNSGNSI